MGYLRGIIKVGSSENAQIDDQESFVLVATLNTIYNCYPYLLSLATATN